MPEKPKCEARYGSRNCENIASKWVISRGQMFTLCEGCAKTAKAQNKLNNNE
jgi:hypothetical protein